MGKPSFYNNVKNTVLAALSGYNQKSPIKKVRTDNIGNIANDIIYNGTAIFNNMPVNRLRNAISYAYDEASGNRKKREVINKSENKLRQYSKTPVEKPLERVYPEFDALMLGRGIKNTPGKREMVTRQLKNEINNTAKKGIVNQGNNLNVYAQFNPENFANSAQNNYRFYINKKGALQKINSSDISKYKTYNHIINYIINSNNKYMTNNTISKANFKNIFNNLRTNEEKIFDRFKNRIVPFEQIKNLKDIDKYKLNKNFYERFFNGIMLRASKATQPDFYRRLDKHYGAFLPDDYELPLKIRRYVPNTNLTIEQYPIDKSFYHDINKQFNDRYYYEPDEFNEFLDGINRFVYKNSKPITDTNRMIPEVTTNYLRQNPPLYNLIDTYGDLETFLDVNPHYDFIKNNHMFKYAITPAYNGESNYRTRRIDRIAKKIKGTNFKEREFRNYGKGTGILRSRPIEFNILNKANDDLGYTTMEELYNMPVKNRFNYDIPFKGDVISMKMFHDDANDALKHMYSEIATYKPGQALMLTHNGSTSTDSYSLENAIYRKLLHDNTGVVKFLKNEDGTYKTQTLNSHGRKRLLYDYDSRTINQDNVDRLNSQIQSLAEESGYEGVPSVKISPNGVITVPSRYFRHLKFGGKVKFKNRF